MIAFSRLILGNFPKTVNSICTMLALKSQQGVDLRQSEGTTIEVHGLKQN